MEKYDVHDKYGNKVGTFEPCEDNSGAVIAAIFLVVIFGGILVALPLMPFALAIAVPLSGFSLLCSYVGQGYFTPLFIIVTMVLTTILELGKVSGEDAKGDWKLALKIAWNCAYPAMLVGALFGTLTGEYFREYDWFNCFTTMSLCAFFMGLGPGEIVAYRRYRQQKKERETRFRVYRRGSLRDVKNILLQTYAARDYQVSYERNWDGYTVSLRKHTGIGSTLLGLTTGLKVRLRMEDRQTVRVEILEKEWLSRLCAVLLMGLLIPMYTGIYGAIKQHQLYKEVLETVGRSVS